MAQLQSSIDSMKVLGDSIGRQYYKGSGRRRFPCVLRIDKEDTAKIEKADIQEYNVDSLYEVSPLMQKQKVISSAVSRAENMASDLTFKSYTMETNDYAIRKHKTGWHKEDNDFPFLSVVLLYQGLRWEVLSVRRLGNACHCIGIGIYHLLYH